MAAKNNKSDKYHVESKITKNLYKKRNMLGDS